MSGSRRNSKDLPQGGLEVPYELVFLGSSNKAKKRIEASTLQQACSVNTVNHCQASEYSAEESGPPAKKTPYESRTLSSEEQDKVDGF